MENQVERVNLAIAAIQVLMVLKENKVLRVSLAKTERTVHLESQAHLVLEAHLVTLDGLESLVNPALQVHQESEDHAENLVLWVLRDLLENRAFQAHQGLKVPLAQEEIQASPDHLDHLEEMDLVVFPVSLVLKVLKVNLALPLSVYLFP